MRAPELLDDNDPLDVAGNAVVAGLWRSVTAAAPTKMTREHTPRAAVLRRLGLRLNMAR
jgi:hypothetical protein